MLILIKFISFISHLYAGHQHTFLIEKQSNKLAIVERSFICYKKSAILIIEPKQKGSGHTGPLILWTIKFFTLCKSETD